VLAGADAYVERPEAEVRRRLLVEELRCRPALGDDARVAGRLAHAAGVRGLGRRPPTELVKLTEKPWQTSLRGTCTGLTPSTHEEITMRNVGAALAMAFVSAVQLSACSHPARVTSLEPNRTLSSLTTEERRQFCEDRFHYAISRVSNENRKKINCSVAAGAVGSGGKSNTDRARAACQQVYQICMSVPAPEPQSPCDAFPRSADDCTATVGEASECAEAQADTLEKLASRAEDTCKNPDRSEESGPDEPAKVACANLQLLCPKLVDEPTLGLGKR
jgi:hypothetical protein